MPFWASVLPKARQPRFAFFILYLFSQRNLFESSQSTAGSCSVICVEHGGVAQSMAQDSDSEEMDALLAEHFAPAGYKVPPSVDQCKLDASVLLSDSDDDDAPALECEKCSDQVGSEGNAVVDAAEMARDFKARSEIVGVNIEVHQRGKH
eukprot:186877-Pleurochrysis_carterae.AAC.1